jgi:hypothetical protein
LELISLQTNYIKRWKYKQLCFAIGFRNDTGNIYYQVAVSGVIQASFISSQSSINTAFSKVAAKWKVNDFAIMG